MEDGAARVNGMIRATMTTAMDTKAANGHARSPVVLGNTAKRIFAKSLNK
jgi:hypothetical protein